MMGGKSETSEPIEVEESDDDVDSEEYEQARKEAEEE